MDITLVELYGADHEALYKRTLYKLLEEREPEANISHVFMPTYEEHIKFVNSEPYLHWFAITNKQDEREVFGACYITHRYEVGVAILKEHRGRGFAKQAIQVLTELYDDVPLLANIAPMNEKSQRLFNRLGFNLVQYTYKRVPNDQL